jgi:hypothetical protein
VNGEHSLRVRTYSGLSRVKIYPFGVDLSPEHAGVRAYFVNKAVKLI